MAAGTVRVKGVNELVRACGGYRGALAKEVRAGVLEAAKLVSDDARSRFARIDSRSAMGLRPQAKASGRALVRQRYGRVTGNRGDFGALQMRRALLPALAAKRPQVIDALDRMLDRLGGDAGF